MTQTKAKKQTRAAYAAADTANIQHEKVSIFIAKEDVPKIAEALRRSIMQHHAVTEAINNHSDLMQLDNLYNEVLYYC